MPHNHDIVDSDKHFVIDPVTKQITTTSEKLTLITGDHNSERYTFEIPKIVEGHDMSTCIRVEIHFNNISSSSSVNKGVYLCKDVQVVDDNLTFSWLISREATKYSGSLLFSVRFICIDGEKSVVYDWRTGIYKNIKIADTVCNSAVIEETVPDYVAKIKQEIAEDISVQEDLYITYLHSPDSDDQYIKLRDLKTGAYVLDGAFVSYVDSDNKTQYFTASTNYLVSLKRTDNATYIQHLSPTDNSVQFVTVTDSSINTKVCELDKLVKSVNGSTPNESGNVIIEIPQADWNQNDETADDYIKNRLGYRYEGGTERESIASIEITSEDMVTYDIDVVSWNGSEIVMVMDNEEYPLTYKDVVNGLYTYVNTDLSLTITEAVIDGTPNIIAPSSMVGKTVEFIKITIDWVYKRIPVKYLDLGGLDGSFQNLRDQYEDTLYHEINVESGGYNCIKDKYDVAEHINLRTQKTPTGGHITIPKLFALGVYTDGTLHVMDEDGNTTPVVSNVLLTSPNGTKFKLTVDNSGTLSTKEMET